ncbi:hypothetical protein CY34DRAFT_381458 [Suillus luteus UH-Slu-Lm8-n1]|uniref:Unplaced genomic scaffold CY34scaffold_25, whole genome shotgun sequence n=1 Tax=Suillus luteus UH-Slu-Lm8-n1 TaxID=930992 RepID=A0A0D0BUJ1_9AGAM|nr:hypothetical protein CY34DRAFT_381458 [Suillus luteus UH-Slu-Lm8-n1]
MSLTHYSRWTSEMMIHQVDSASEMEEHELVGILEILRTRLPVNILPVVYISTPVYTVPVLYPVKNAVSTGAGEVLLANIKCSLRAYLSHQLTRSSPMSYCCGAPQCARPNRDRNF